MKKKGMHILPLMAAALLLPSCTKTTAPQTGEAVIIPEVSIESAVPAAVEAATKAVITGTSFPNESSYSVWICNEGTYDEFNLNSRNICATRSGSAWSYHYDGFSVSFTNIIMRRVSLASTLDLYAYAPFISGVRDLEGIAFTASNQQDLMYALENSTDINKGKSITAPATSITSLFRFHHALSLVELRVRNKNAGSTINVSQTWLKSSGDTQIYTAGIFNAITGAVTGTKTGIATATQNGSNGINITSTYTSIRMLVIPTECRGDDLSIGLVMNGVGGVDSGVNSFPVSREELRHSSSDEYGFLPGYRYVFTVEIDNYVHLTGIEIETDWTDLEMPEKEI